MGFLKALFGPSKEEIWIRLASEVGGEFHQGGLLSGTTGVQARTGDWIITLDTFTDSDEQTYTRLRAPYVNLEGFTFEIYDASVFSGIGTALGLQDIEVGHPRFDRDFVIKGNSPTRVRRLFANDRIRSLISAQPRVRLSVKQHDGWFSAYPEGVHELYFQSPGIVKDLVQLRALFDLFSEVLHQVCHDGKAYEDDVRIHIARLSGPGGKVEDGFLLWEGYEARRDAAEALGRLRDAIAVPSLASALRDDDELLRTRAIDALAAIPHEEAVRALIPLLGASGVVQGGAIIRDRVAEALRNRGEAAVVDVVLAALEGERTALKAYDAGYRVQVLEALAEALDGSAGGHAARALADVHAVAALPRLREVMRRTGRRHANGPALDEAIKTLEGRAALPRPARPRPAAASDGEPGTLPRAAAEPGPETSTLPRLPEGEA